MTVVKKKEPNEWMTLQKPFENATAMLDFLERDEPERYVFRGQTRAYGGPMLPSGFRDRFTPFDASSGPSEWAGITTSKSVIDDEVNTRRQDVSTMTATGEDVDDGRTTWDLPEVAYQRGFRDFFNQPHRNPDDHDLAVEKSVREMDTVIPILLSRVVGK